MILEVEHLTRRFGARTAVQDVNLRVEAGEIIGGEIVIWPIVAGSTVSTAVALAAPSVALSLALPVLTAVTTPSLSIRATAALDDLQAM